MRPVDVPLAGPLLDQERTGIVLHDLDGGAVAEAAHPGAVCKRDRDGGAGSTGSKQPRSVISASARAVLRGSSRPCWRRSSGIPKAGIRRSPEGSYDGVS